VGKKQKPFITRIQAEGTTAEKRIASEQLRKRVETFNTREEFLGRMELPK